MEEMKNNEKTLAYGHNTCIHTSCGFEFCHGPKVTKTHESSKLRM